jgi:hypothetical protein
MVVVEGGRSGCRPPSLCLGICPRKCIIISSLRGPRARKCLTLNDLRLKKVV